MTEIIAEWPAFRHPSKVVSVNKNSALILRLKANYSPSKRVWVFDEETIGDEHLIKLSEIKVICDTVDEANIVNSKSRDSISEFYDARDRVAKSFNEIDGFRDAELGKRLISRHLGVRR